MTESTDDKLKAEALEWLVSLRGTAEKATGFVLDQAPDVLRELVTLGRISITAEAASCLCFIAIMVWYVRTFANQDSGKMSDNSFVASIIGLVVSLIFGVISLVVLVTNFRTIACVWFAPRIYILEQLAELAKAVKP